jgi:hypothetical protein
LQIAAASKAVQRQTIKIFTHARKLTAVEYFDVAVEA